jgi:threonine dehydrogenase-like Zn-dependent dehydrogenase
MTCMGDSNGDQVWSHIKLIHESIGHIMMVGDTYSNIFARGETVCVDSWRNRDASLADYVAELSM